MKKLLVLALAVVMIVSAFALTACAKEVTYTGEDSYVAWGHTYGCKVNVTVKGDVIVKVEFADHDYVMTSDTWTGKADAEAAYADYLASFAGKTVAEVSAWEVTRDADASFAVTLGAGVPGITNATQSAARIILAVQNALSQIA